VLKRSG